MHAKLEVRIYPYIPENTLFANYLRDVLSALEIFYENALYKFALYLLTYFISSDDIDGCHNNTAM